MTSAASSADMTADCLNVSSRSASATTLAGNSAHFTSVCVYNSECPAVCCENEDHPLSASETTHLTSSSELRSSSMVECSKEADSLATNANDIAPNARSQNVAGRDRTLSLSEKSQSSVESESRTMGGCSTAQSLRSTESEVLLSPHVRREDSIYSATAAAANITSEQCRLLTRSTPENHSGVASTEDMNENNGTEQRQTQESLDRISRQDMSCPLHHGELLQKFCVDCSRELCALCNDAPQHHAGHLVCALQETRRFQLNILQALGDRLEEKIDSQTRQQKNVREALHHLALMQETVGDSVQNYCNSLAEAVELRRKHLLDSITSIAQNHSNLLNDQLDRVETRLIELEACSRYVRHSQTAVCESADHQSTGDSVGNDRQLLLLSKQVAMRVTRDEEERCEGPLADCCCRICGHSSVDVRFETTDCEDLPLRLRDFGRITDKSRDLTTVSPDSDLSVRTSSIDDVASLQSFHPESVNQCSFNSASPHTAAISPNNINSTDCKSAMIDHIAGRPPPFQFSGNVANRRVSSHASSGAVALSSRCTSGVGGRLSRISRRSATSVRRPSDVHPALVASCAARRWSSVASSSKYAGTGDWSTAASTPVSCRSNALLSHVPRDDLVQIIGSRGRGKGQFSNPQGVGYSSTNDRLLVADSSNQCVQVFSLDGQCKLRFGTRGRRTGQMQRPCGVCSTPCGYYAVTDYENRCVHLHSQTGAFVRRFGSAQLQGPKGITIDPRGNYLVVDNRASSVLTFCSSSGRMLHRLGCRGVSSHQLAGPHFAAVDSRNRIVVSDFHNHAVKVFSLDGRYLLSFGGRGVAQGQMNAPTGLTVDHMDNIIVADWGNSRIQVFSPDGRYVQCVNSSASRLYGPQGLLLTPQSHLAVADSGNHAVKLYNFNCTL